MNLQNMHVDRRAPLRFALGAVAAGALALGASSFALASGDDAALPAPSLVLQSDGPEAAALRAAAAAKPDKYQIDLPPHFRTIGAERFESTPASNPTTDAGATLGRYIFYDQRVSADRTMSCASCHDQSHGFTDVNRFSRGFDGRLTERKAMNLVNLRFHPRGRFFWDERAESLEDAVLEPMQSRVELGGTIEAVVAAIAADDSYRPLFRAAFGSDEVTRERVGKALAQFLRSIVSYRSRYDDGAAKAERLDDDFPNFSIQENRGKRVFLASCATCHARLGQGAHFVLLRPMNNGLDDDFRAADGGVGDVTFNARERGIFKSPGLRNVEVTGPYMHDGRFNTLEEVVEHYSSGVKEHPRLGNENLRRFEFDAEQKAALVAFMKTLTDRALLADPRYSNPYRLPSERGRGATPAPAPASAAAVLAWLAAFDTNHDGAIDAAEAAPLGVKLEALGLARGPRGRLTLQREGDGRNLGGGLSAVEFSLRAALRTLDRNRDGRLEPEEAGAELIALGDANRDGHIDADEMEALAERYQKEAIPPALREPVRRALLERSDDTVAASARDRLIDVVMYLPGPEGFNGDRLYAALAPLDLTPELQSAVAKTITDHQRWLVDDAEEAKARLLADLHGVLGDAWFEKLQKALETRETRGRIVGDPAARRARTAAQLTAWLFAGFDRNEDGKLEAEDLQVLCHRLIQMPGGFDPQAREVSGLDDDRDDAEQRILALDRNGDGRVAVAEIPDRLRARYLEFDADKSGDLDPAEIRKMVAEAHGRPPRRDNEPGINVASPLTGVALGRVLSKERIEEVLAGLGLPRDPAERAAAITARLDDQRRMDVNRRILMKKLVAVLGPKLGDAFLDALASQEIHPDRRPPAR